MIDKLALLSPHELEELERSSPSFGKSSSPLDMREDDLPCFVAAHAKDGSEHPAKALSYTATDRGYFYECVFPSGSKFSLHALFVRPITEDEYGHMVRQALKEDT